MSFASHSPPTTTKLPEGRGAFVVDAVPLAEAEARDEEEPVEDPKLEELDREEVVLAEDMMVLLRARVPVTVLLRVRVPVAMVELDTLVLESAAVVEEDEVLGVPATVRLYTEMRSVPPHFSSVAPEGIPVQPLLHFASDSSRVVGRLLPQ